MSICLNAVLNRNRFKHILNFFLSLGHEEYWQNHTYNSFLLLYFSKYIYVYMHCGLWGWVLFGGLIQCIFSQWLFLSFRLESPTRSLVMEAPRGVQVNAAAGDLKATCRKELHLQSTEGEVSSDGREMFYISAQRNANNVRIIFSAAR